MHMTVLTNLNGELSTNATVSVLDRGFLYGDSVYEVVRTYQGQMFALQEHLDRLRRSADYLYMSVPWTDAEIQAEIERTLTQVTWVDSYIRIVVSRGSETTISLDPSPGLTPNLLIMVKETPADPVFVEDGLYLAIVDRLRNDIRALSPAAKTGNYLNNILAKIEAQKQGADDALLLNADGWVTESTVSNLWVVKDGTLKTPQLDVGILQGVTRHFVFQLLREQQIPAAEALLKPDDLWAADEIFLSSSVRLIIPIRQINDHPMPQCPGPITRGLWKSFLERMAR